MHEFFLGHHSPRSGRWNKARGEAERSPGLADGVQTIALEKGDGNRRFARASCKKPSRCVRFRRPTSGAWPDKSANPGLAMLALGCIPTSPLGIRPLLGEARFDCSKPATVGRAYSTTGYSRTVNRWQRQSPFNSHRQRRWINEDLVACGSPQCSVTPCGWRKTRVRRPQGATLQSKSTAPKAVRHPRIVYQLSLCWWGGEVLHRARSLPGQGRL